MKNDKPPSRGSGLLPDVPSEFDFAHDAPRLGDYLISARLAVGRVTEVRMAFDVTFARRVVIKRLLPEFVQDPVCRARFQRGARLQAQIRHAGVPAVHGADLDGELPYFAMELVEGHTLAEFAQAAGALPPEVVALIGCDLARTLQDLHETGAVHRQLMPEHILIDQHGVGRLVVIGFSQVAVPEPDDQEPLTGPGTLIGALHHAAPEQLACEPVDERADVYALGVMLYELCTGGDLPWTAPTVSEQLQAIRAQDHLRLHKKNRRMPAYVGTTIERCLHFDPGKRPESMAAVALTLAAGLRDEGFVDVPFELGSLFEAPHRVLEDHRERMVKTLVERMQLLTAEGKRKAALSAGRRALAWNPKNETLKALLTQLKQGIDPGKTRDLHEILEPHPQRQAEKFMHDMTPQETMPDEETTNEAAPRAEGRSPAAETPAAEAILVVEARPPAQPPPATLAVVEAGPKPVGEAQRLPAARWVRGGMAAAALFALAFWLLPYLRPSPAPPSRPHAGEPAGLEAVLRTPLTRRPFTARLQEPALAIHRPPPRAEEPEQPRIQIDPEALARLEQRRDFHAVALGSLLKGGPGSEAQALAYFDQIDPPPSEETAGKILKLRLSPSRNPHIDSERALVFLELKNPAEAFRLTVSALLASPEHPVAQWNQALALQDLTLTRTSATVFGRIQASGEPGWSEEAGMRMAALQAADEAKRLTFEEMQAKGRAMVAGGPVVPESLVEIAPGHVQLYFYDAVRTATSAARVMELLPLAEALDRHNSNGALERYVRRIAAKFSMRRAQLAGLYAQLAANYDALKGGALEDYFAQLRAAGEGDMLLGAMVLTQRVSDHLAEFRQLARVVGDPWFDLLAENEAADVEMARGEYPRAEDRLLAALTKCGEQGLEFRCARLQRSLTRLYISLCRLPEAEMRATAGLELARKAGDYTAETTFLGDLGVITYHRNDSALSRAYLDETALREPLRCERQRFVHEDRALGYLANELSFEDARREILAMPLCGQPRSLTSLNVMVNLDRVGLAVESPTALRQELAALRRQGGLKPGELAIATYIEGLLVIQHDRVEGRALLLQAIAMAQRWPNWDADARNVLTYAYQELILDHAKAGEPREALVTLAEQLGFPRPSQCVLGALVADERSLVVGLDANGVAHQRYEARRASPDIDVARFVPEDIKTALRGCAHVDVLAHPLFYRSSYLLPPDIEWSFRGGTLVPEGTKSKPYLLIVRDPELPPGLRLKPRAPWDQNVVATKSTILEGGRATPFNVQTKMQDATEVLFDVPCLTANGEEYLALSGGADRRYALTATMVLRNPLPHGPVIGLLGSCGSGAASNRQDVLSLAMSFRQAGGRAVLAAVGSIPAVEGRQFLGKVLERTRTQRPAAALREERMIWLKQKNREWINHIILTE